MKTEQWALLWSGRQKALHVESVEDMLTANRAACAADVSRDYVPLCIGTRAEVEEATAQLRPVLMLRAQSPMHADRLAAANRSAA